MDLDRQGSAESVHHAVTLEVMQRARLIDVGVTMLVAGWIAAALIYIYADDPRADVEFANPRAYENQIERIGGKATVYAVRFNEWFASLWHGRPLAYTVAVLAIVAATICFWLAAAADRNEKREN